MKIKDNIVDLILTLIAVVGFIYGYFSENYWTIPASFGICFIGFSIRSLMAKGNGRKLTLLMISLMVTGLCIFVAGLLWGIGPYDIRDWIEDNKVALILTIPVFIGVSLIMASIDQYKNRIRRCDLEVTAECVELVSKVDSEGRQTFSPVWEIYHNGEKKRITRDFYTNIKKMLPEVGEKRVLHVDSISFDDYFEGKTFDASCKIFLFMGIGFAVIGLIATLIAVFAF